MEFSFQTESAHSSVLAKLRSLDQDKESKLLDNSYLETAIFSLFKIDILNFIKVKSILAKEFHIQPSEIDAMPAWEYELFTREINQAVKEENERNKAEMDKAGYDKAQKMSDPKYAQRMAQNQMPKMPNMGSFKPPKF